jgi:hypothetical protein
MYISYGFALLLTAVPEASFQIRIASTLKFSNLSPRPLGQRTCTHSTLVAEPNPKFMRMSLLEPAAGARNNSAGANQKMADLNDGSKGKNARRNSSPDCMVGPRP